MADATTREGPPATRYSRRTPRRATTSSPPSEMFDAATLVEPQESDAVPSEEYEDSPLPGLDGSAVPATPDAAPLPDELDGYDLERLESAEATSGERPSYRPPSRY